MGELSWLMPSALPVCFCTIHNAPRPDSGLAPEKWPAFLISLNASDCYETGTCRARNEASEISTPIRSFSVSFNDTP